MNSHLSGFVSPPEKSNRKVTGHVCFHTPNDPTDMEILLGCCDSGAKEDPLNGFKEVAETIPVKGPGELGNFNGGSVEINEAEVYEHIDSDGPVDFRDGIKLHDPKRPSHRLKLKFHPECESDEVYLLNATPKGFDLIRWETKRKGEKTECGCCPVFVKREELLTAGYRLIKPKKSKQQAVA